MNPPLDGGVFRRQSERVPSHGMNHVEALHAPEPRGHVADGVIAHVPHVQRAGRIRQHFEHVVFRLGRIGIGLERVVRVPARLPFPFNRLWIVFRHGRSPLP